MQPFAEEQRFVLAVGDTVDGIAEDSRVTVIYRLDRVVLLEATHEAAVKLRHTRGLVVHVFDREKDARRAFALFQE